MIPGTDFTPVVEKGYKDFLLGPIIVSIIITVIIFFLGSPQAAKGVFQGFVIGMLDIVIMTTGMRKALPFREEPKKGLSVMKRYRWYRIISASSLVVLLLKQGMNVTGVFIGLLLMHIFLIFNLILITYRLNKGKA